MHLPFRLGQTTADRDRIAVAKADGGWVHQCQGAAVALRLQDGVYCIGGQDDRGLRDEGDSDVGVTFQRAGQGAQGGHRGVMHGLIFGGAGDRGVIAADRDFPEGDVVKFGHDIQHIRTPGVANGSGSNRQVGGSADICHHFCQGRGHFG